MGWKFETHIVLFVSLTGANKITYLVALFPISGGGPYSPAGWAVPIRPPSDLNFPPLPKSGRFSLPVPAVASAAAASMRALLLLLRLMGNARPNILTECKQACSQTFVVG